MDNQHRKIKGYRELTEHEIMLMNKVKTLGAEIGEVIDLLETHSSVDADKRWLAIGKTDIQKGLMAVTRSIAKPDFF